MYLQEIRIPLGHIVTAPSMTRFHSLNSLGGSLVNDYDNASHTDGTVDWSNKGVALIGPRTTCVQWRKKYLDWNASIANALLTMYLQF